jgi:ferredoxin
MITKVWFDTTYDECIACGACEVIAESVFHVVEKTDEDGQTVGDLIINEKEINSHADEVREAAITCPAECIKMAETKE